MPPCGTQWLKFTVKGLKDPAPGVPLSDITLFSSRAFALVVRNQENPMLTTGFDNIYGKIDMIEQSICTAAELVGGRLF